MYVVKSGSILECQSNTILGIPSYLYWYKTPNELLHNISVQQLKTFSQ